MIEPTPEFQACLLRLIDELKTGLQWGVNGFCKDSLHALPLWENQIYAWALNTDGNMLILDKDAYAYRPEPVDDPVEYYAYLFLGSHRYPELKEFVPAPPPGINLCTDCEAQGQIGSEEQECSSCEGRGFFVRKR